MKRLLVFLLAAVSAFAAPVYNANPPVPLSAGVTAVVWNAETPAQGNGNASASQQVQLSPRGSGTTFSVDGHFSGAPGVFEVDVQVAAVDNDTDYQTISGGAITTVDSVNNTFHLDAAQVNSKFSRLLMRSRTNAVSITARISQ